MCVIIIKQKDNVMSKEVAKTSSRINPHGLGIIWLDTFEVEYHKSKDYHKLLTKRPFIAHFRYATKGKINRANTHPFVCGNNKDEYLMHNGTIQGMGNKECCDSKMLANKLGTINRMHWKKELEQYDSRFVSVNVRTRSFQIYNRNLYTYRDGIWYSKANVLQDNLIAVYGTLKKGYGNYYAYLTNAKHLGRGTTKDKYPLVVSGLPYLVDEKGRGHNVVVDVFKVSDAQLQRVDQLEGHPRWYKRKQIDIKLKNRTLKCWIYFNPQVITSTTQLHRSFERTARPTQQVFTFQDVEPTYDTTEFHEAIDIGWDDNDFPTDQTPTCIDCFNDLEHDAFHNYYCSSCGGWFKEDEVLRFNEE
ncbi:MAG: putative gamma-glutamylcyclotransferase [Prokaryotic dsDNA virus sp.]|nr:MAG: putative gamma-glutamylcyclotransferase [Prokaryotic dsDNA virus sp.]|tara:strand:- start:756 stop:1835 length:1080 start_codon:yes stop_codon:yes gene_type:complete